MVTYKEKTQTYKFKYFVPEHLKRQIWSFGVRLFPIIILIVIIGSAGGLRINLFNFETSLRLGIGIIVFGGFVYAALYSMKIAILTYDEVILTKDRIGFLKKRIPYFEIKEVGFALPEPKFLSFEKVCMPREEV